jgi:hypothetical protein
MKTELILDDHRISHDALGRFNLSDLYRAAGSQPRHRPSYWLTNSRTRKLIEALKLEAGIPASNSGKGLNLEAGIPASKFEPVATVKGHGITATYVVMELVYDYAMWVSPDFELKVIRTFHALQTRPRIQHEKALAARYPFYPTLRELALDGKKDVEIAPLIGRSPGSAGYHRNKQFKEGYTDPVEFAHKRYPSATAHKVIAKRGWDAWGSDYASPQTGFNFEFAGAAA